MILNTKYNIQNTKALTGGAAVAEALKQINPDVMPVYPITPQTPIIETFAKFKADGEVETEIIEVESEHSAMSACVGSSAAGARTVTATSSQGLALMHEVLYIASGLRLPILLIDSARALAAPLNIHGDHSDVMGARDAGWAMLFAENVQEAYDNTLIALKLAEVTHIPVMAVLDGFQTSHTVENLEILDTEKVRKFVGEFKPKESLLNLNDPVSFGPVALQNSYFEFKIDQAKAMQAVFGEYKRIATEFEKASGRFYDFFESYRAEDAEYIIICMGTAAGTAKEVVDKLRGEGKKAGLLKIRLFRPFPHHEIDVFLAHAKRIAVLDKAMAIGSTPPLYTDVLCSMYNVSSMNGEKKYFIPNTEYFIQSYVYGLGGRDLFMTDIEKVFDDLMNSKMSKETKYIGNKN